MVCYCPTMELDEPNEDEDASPDDLEMDLRRREANEPIG